MTDIKQSLLNKILSDLDERIESVKQAIDSAKESRDNETKSSVGDKYETGRTLMQFEVEKNRVQLEKTKKLKSELLKINLLNKYQKIEFGSLVITDMGNFFISIAIGRIELDNSEYFCISLASPIGKSLHHKKTGDHFSFNGNKVSIKEII